MKRKSLILFLLLISMVCSGCKIKGKIISPNDNATFALGEPISFAAEITGFFHGCIDNGTLVWHSTKDGKIGTGKSFVRSDLSKGVDNITLSYAGPRGTETLDTTQITVGNFHETQVTFVDKGAVVPEAVSTTVIISPHSIKYVSSQSGTIIEQWSKQIQSSDFDSVQQTIDDYNLSQINDITLAEGQMPCDGWSGMTIIIDKAESVHSFDIMGDVCSRDQWPEGVHALVDLQDALVLKYQ